MLVSVLLVLPDPPTFADGLTVALPAVVGGWCAWFGFRAFSNLAGGSSGF